MEAAGTCWQQWVLRAPLRERVSTHIIYIPEHAQRVMIAISLACSPKLPIADERTAALEFTL
jgi:hypothetical protein